MIRLPLLTILLTINLCLSIANLIVFLLLRSQFDEVLSITRGTDQGLADLETLSQGELYQLQQVALATTKLKKCTQCSRRDKP